MNDQATLLKVAYLKGLEKAVTDSGIDPELLKEAGLGSWLAKGVGKLLYRPAQYAAAAPGATAKGLRGFLGLAPKGELLRGAGGLLPGAGRFAKNLAGFGLKPVVGAGGKPIARTGMTKLYKAMTLGGRQVPSTMLQYGALGGAMGGLMGGKPGEGWSWSGAGKGFLGGAAGGLGWAAGGRLARGAIGKALGSKAIVPGSRLAGFAQRGQKVWGLGKQPGFLAQRIPGTFHKGKMVAEAPGVGFGQLGKQFIKSWKTPAGGAAQSLGAGFRQSLKGMGSAAKDVGVKAALGVPIAAGVVGGSLLAEDVASRAMGQPGAATSPEAWARRGYYTMTPSGRMAFYG